MPVTWTFSALVRLKAAILPAFPSPYEAVPQGASNKYFNCLLFMYLVTHTHAKSMKWQHEVYGQFTDSTKKTLLQRHLQ